MPAYTMATHEALRAWQLCHKLALAVYGATDEWPRSERYELTSQARKAGHSAAANIAEGWAKHGSRELCRYLNISLGSLAELGYTMRLAHDRGILTGQAWSELDKLRGASEAITWRLYKAVKTRSGGAK
jgi:four helix bundle protein